MQGFWIWNVFRSDPDPNVKRIQTGSGYYSFEKMTDFLIMQKNHFLFFIFVNLKCYVVALLIVSGTGSSTKNSYPAKRPDPV